MTLYFKMVITFLKEKPINQDKFVVVLMLLSNVAMEVLIKYCTNSFPKLTNSFNRKLSTPFKIAQLPYCLFVIGQYLLK